MKKRIIALVLCSVMLSLTACEAKDVSSLMGKGKEESTTEAENETEEKKMDMDTEKDDSKEKSKTPTFGDNDDTYEGFSYLYTETLATESETDEKSGKMKNQKLNVYIPQDEYNYVGRNNASADKLGVSFDIELNPYLRYDEDDYLPEENLQYYIDENFDEFYNDHYKDVEKGEIETLDNGVKAKVTYCDYDEYDDSYSVHDKTYYYVTLNDELNAMVIFDINPEETTGKTDALISELESYYNISLDWDKKAAESKLAAFLENPNAEGNKISNGYMIFELPEGWKADNDYGDYSDDIYAPDGNVYSKNGFVKVEYEYVGSEIDNIKNMSDSDIDEMMSIALGDDINSTTIEKLGETNLGYTISIKMEAAALDNNATVTQFMAFRDGYVYAVSAVEAGDSDAEAVAKDIIYNAVLKD